MRSINNKKRLLLNIKFNVKKVCSVVTLFTSTRPNQTVEEGNKQLFSLFHVIFTVLYKTCYLTISI